MKKEYTQPQTKIRSFKTIAILSGSVSVDDGTTSEQKAKANIFDFNNDEGFKNDFDFNNDEE